MPGVVHMKSRPGVRSNRHAQVWLASIYNHGCGVGFRASSFAPPTPPRVSGVVIEKVKVLAKLAEAKNPEGLMNFYL